MDNEELEEIKQDIYAENIELLKENETLRHNCEMLHKQNTLLSKKFNELENILAGESNLESYEGIDRLRAKVENYNIEYEDYLKRRIDGLTNDYKELKKKCDNKTKKRAAIARKVKKELAEELKNMIDSIIEEL